MITRDRVLELGFKELPHFTVMDSLIYDLDRNRHLSLDCVGTPNEMLFICEVNEEHNKIIDDAVVLSNYDYDGYLTEERLSLLLTFFAQKTDKK